MMTIGQLDYALKEKTPIFLRAVTGKKKGIVADILLSESVICALENIEE